MSIRTIIFDFGNVLATFDKARTTRRLALYSPFSVETLHAQLFDTGLEHAFEAGEISADLFIGKLQDVGQLSCEAGFVAQAWGDIFTPVVEMCRLLPQLSAHYRLVLASNTNELHARWFLPEFQDVFKAFRTCILSYEIGVRKPSPGFYEACMKRAECAAHECVFIDDLPANVAGAVACGLQGIVFQGYAQLLNQLSELHIQPKPRT